MAGETILVVDDEMAELITKMLSALDYEAIMQDKPLEALEIFRADPDKFDIVVTDQTMPEMKGVELAREIFKIRPEIPVIIITGFSEDTISLGNNIKKILMKPLRIAELDQAIMDTLGN